MRSCSQRLWSSSPRICLYTRSCAAHSSTRNSFHHRTSMAAVQANLLVVSSPESPELEVLKRLPAGVNLVAVGKTLQDLSHLSEDQWKSINVLLNCGVGKNAATRNDIQALWPRLPNLQWMHSASAGLEHLLFPELRDGPVVLTNAKGVYSHSLAEYTLTACNWFAKDLPRLRRAQKDKLWDPYEVEELRGKTLGVIGYGDIGQACARLARAFKMRVVALRRRTQLTEAEVAEGVVLVNATAIAAMRPHAVFINVGRGKCVDEAALVQALQERRIRGAALDVFETEPLPQSSPLWELDNVLMSPHCADRTKEFQFESLELFVENVGRFVAGQDLKNITDKKAGY